MCARHWACALFSLTGALCRLAGEALVDGDEAPSSLSATNDVASVEREMKTYTERTILAKEAARDVIAVRWVGREGWENGGRHYELLFLLQWINVIIESKKYKNVYISLTGVDTIMISYDTINFVLDTQCPILVLQVWFV